MVTSVVDSVVVVVVVSEVVVVVGEAVVVVMVVVIVGVVVVVVVVVMVMVGVVMVMVMVVLGGAVEVGVVVVMAVLGVVGVAPTVVVTLLFVANVMEITPACALVALHGELKRLHHPFGNDEMLSQSGVPSHWRLHASRSCSIPDAALMYCSPAAAPSHLTLSPTVFHKFWHCSQAAHVCSVHFSVQGSSRSRHKDAQSEADGVVCGAH